MSSRVRTQPRASVTSTGMPSASGSVTVLVRPSAGLTPELEKLRTQDINPDANSAASIALAVANGGTASATVESDGERHTRHCLRFSTALISLFSAPFLSILQGKATPGGA